MLVRFEPAQRAQRQLELLSGGNGLLANLARRDLDVLVGNRIDDVHGRQIAGRQLVGVQPDAHAVIACAEDLDVADSLDAEDFILKLDRGEIGEVKARRSGRPARSG